jgi:hypothetical protein
VCLFLFICPLPSLPPFFTTLLIDDQRVNPTVEATSDLSFFLLRFHSSFCHLRFFFFHFNHSRVRQCCSKWICGYPFFVLLCFQLRSLLMSSTTAIAVVAVAYYFCRSCYIYIYMLLLRLNDQPPPPPFPRLSSLLPSSATFSSFLSFFFTSPVFVAPYLFSFAALLCCDGALSLLYNLFSLYCRCYGAQGRHTFVFSSNMPFQHCRYLFTSSCIRLFFD